MLRVAFLINFHRSNCLSYKFCNSYNICKGSFIRRTCLISKKSISYRSTRVKNNFIALQFPYSGANICSLCYVSVKFAHSSNVKDIPEVSASYIKDILASKNIEVIDGYTCFNIKCPLCLNAKKHELYVNKVTGFVICSGCRYSGQWIEFEELLKKSKSSTSEQHPRKFNHEVGDKWKELCKTLTPFTSLSFHEKKLLYNELQLKNLSDNLCDHLNMYVDNNVSNLYIPLKCRNEVVGYKVIKLKQENSITKEISDVEDSIQSESEITEPLYSCRGVLLFKSKSLKKDRAILVHNVKDFFSLAEHNLSYHIICLPYGLTNLPQEVLPILEKYEKIVLWFGNDSTCWDAAKQFSRKLNEDRCYFVRPVKENPPAHIVSFEDGCINKIKQIIENAESVKHPSIISFSSMRQDILSELQNIDKAQGVRWKRFPGLNSLLKGFRRGELTIFTGPTGSGKTTFLSEYSLDLLTQGVSTLWGSFEVRNQRLARIMLQQFVQLPLDLYPDKLNYWADCFERLPLHFLTFHGQQPLKVVLEAVEHASYVYDISHVIIDNVQFMLGMMDTETNLDRFYRQDALIASFRNFATTKNCHVTLVIHPRKEKDSELLTINSVFGGAKASQEADNVLIIQQKMLQSLKIKKYLQIAKNRFTGDLGLIPLDFDKETLSFSARNDKKQQKKYGSDKKGNESEDNTKDLSVIEDLHVLQ